MGKKNKSTRVPAADVMDNETFLKHLDKRHMQDTGVEKKLSRLAMESWISVYRAFHERCHAIAINGQYDHEHEDK